MAFIRSFQSSDSNAMVHIFRETAGVDLREDGDPTLNYASYVWCRPYFLLQPENCFVLDNGDGRAVGYMIGTPNTYNYVQKYLRDYIPELENLGVFKPSPDEPADWDKHMATAVRNIVYTPEQMLHKDWPKLLEEYPGHLHIDILEPYHRKGFGRQLVEVFLAKLKEMGCTGVHLGMVATNDNAGKFYSSMGFKRFPQILDGGVSGEEGREKNTIWFVKKL